VTVPRIGVLECDHVADRYRSIGGDYFAMFECVLPTLALVRYDVVNGATPTHPDECDGWLATGSRHSVYEDIDWISRLGAFVRAVHASDTPFVGVCFGHQLIAHFTGGHTEQSVTGWGVGAHVLNTGERLLYVQQDQVAIVPPDGRVVASTAHCPHAVITVGEHMLGIQAHPEFSADYVAVLLEARRERIGHDRVEEALASLDAPRDEPAAAAWMRSALEH